jgi:hypothetical protein
MTKDSDERMTEVRGSALLDEKFLIFTRREEGQFLLFES